MTTYPLMDVPTGKELERLGVTTNGYLRYRKAGGFVQVRAQRTDQYRRPKAGEWFLSGAEPEAYRAYHDLGNCYQIMRLVAMRKVETWEEV